MLPTREDLRASASVHLVFPDVHCEQQGFQALLMQTYIALCIFRTMKRFIKHVADLDCLHWLN